MSTPALDRATEANFDSHQDVALALHDVPKVPLSTMPEWVREQWTINTRRAVSAALHDDDEDVIAGVLRTHRIECTGIEGVTCRECRNLGWMGRWTFAKHQADAVRAAILGEA